MLDQSEKFMPFIGAIVTVTLTAIAQTCLKIGMNTIATQHDAESAKTIFHYSFNILTNPHVFAGLVGYMTSTLLWLYVLSRLPLSTAYPFVGLSIVFTSMFGVYYLNEPNSAAKIVGVLLVSAGVVLVTKG